MFEKSKARLVKLEEDHESIRNAVKHVKDNKVAYIGAPIVLGVGFVAGKYFQRPITIDFKPTINLPEILNAPVFNNHVENTIKLGGRVSKVVRDSVTGEEWQKIRYLSEELAKEHGISLATARTLLSKHLQGHTDHVFGKTYEIAGLRTDFMN